MSEHDIEKLLSQLKPANLPAETEDRIISRLGKLDASGRTAGRRATLIPFTPERRAVILKAAAAFFVLAGAGILIRTATTRPDNGAPARSETAPAPAIASAKPDTGMIQAPALQLAESGRVDPDSLVPVSIRTHLLSESDEGIIMTPQGPMRMLKYQLQDDYEWPHPCNSNRIIKSLPREHVVFTSINSN